MTTFSTQPTPSQADLFPYTITRSKGHEVGVTFRRIFKSSGKFFGSSNAKTAAVATQTTISSFSELGKFFQQLTKISKEAPFFIKLNETLKYFKDAFIIFSFATAFFNVAIKIANLADTAFNLEEVSQEKINKEGGEDNYIPTWVPIFSSRFYTKTQLKKKIKQDIIAKRIVSFITSFLFFAATTVIFVAWLGSSKICNIPHLRAFKIAAKASLMFSCSITFIIILRKLHANYLKTKKICNLEKIPQYNKALSSIAMFLIGLVGLISLFVKTNKITTFLLLMLSIKVTAITMVSYTINEIIKYRKEDQKLLNKSSL